MLIDLYGIVLLSYLKGTSGPVGTRQQKQAARNTTKLAQHNKNKPQHKRNQHNTTETSHNTMKLTQHNGNKPQHHEFSITQRKQTTTN